MSATRVTLRLSKPMEHRCPIQITVMWHNINRQLRTWRYMERAALVGVRLK